MLAARSAQETARKRIQRNFYCVNNHSVDGHAIEAGALTRWLLGLVVVHFQNARSRRSPEGY
jgi:hypothetical protein